MYYDPEADYRLASDLEIIELCYSCHTREAVEDGRCGACIGGQRYRAEVRAVEAERFTQLGLQAEFE